MENKRKLYSIALASATLVFVFSILISSVASASQVTAQVTRIGNGSDPAIYGNKVVWTESGVIHVYDLASKTDTTVSSSAASHPAIYDNKLVWHDESSGTPRLAVYDISTAAKTYITQNVDQSSRPAIYGNRIVWSADYSDMNRNNNVYMRDVSTSTQARIAYGWDPDIYDTKITYSDNGGSIYVYNVTTKETIIPSYSGDLASPHIYSNKVIWSNFYARMGYISMYDIATGRTIDITNESSSDPDGSDAGCDTGTHTDISGDKIVYAKSSTDQFGSAGVYVYNISTAQTTQVFDYGTNIFTTPNIYDNTIVWGIDNTYGADTANDNGIYISDLPTTNTVTPITASTVNVTADFYSPQVDQLRDFGESVPTNETISFIDKSTGSPTSWLWDFGDGTNSTSQNPTHSYTREGGYTVTLTVKNEMGSNKVSKYGYVIVDMGGDSIYPAYFSSNVTSGIIPFTVLFHDTTAPYGSEYAYGRIWDFGDMTNYGDDYDENNSTYLYVTHTYKKPGKYTVSLTSYDVGGVSTITKYNYITVIDPKMLVADFSANVTSGTAPLTVLFADTGTQGIGAVPTSWYWDFGDGINSKHAMNATHTFTKPGNYTISLTVENTVGNNTTTKPSYIVVTDPNAPVANFSSNVTEGYAPLTVQFNDLSQKATSRTWDFNNDGQPDSSEINPVYVYRVPGIYTVNLTAGNGNGTTSKTATINVYEYGSSSGSSSRSSGGSSHSSNGGSGSGAGSSPEPQSNVQVKEISQAFIGSESPATFDFTQQVTPAIYVSFVSKKTVGRTTTIVEMLKNKSTLVTGVPSDEIYKFMNIWVGNSGFATPDNIENAVVYFKVAKSWVQDDKIDKSSITLNRYSDKTWSQLPTSLISEDDNYLYLKAKTPGFSLFAITGKTTTSGTQAQSMNDTQNNATAKIDQTPERTQNSNTSGKAGTKTPGFETASGIVCLLSVFLYKRSF
jgi:FOG: PKD repeat